MKRRRTIIKTIIVHLLVFFCVAFIPRKEDRVIIQYPASWPKPEYDFAERPLSYNIVQLGRKLFYDPILSKDSTISCSSCHLSYTAFTHVDHPVSHGINDSMGTRNAPVLINLAWNKLLMWDGAINHIEVQAMAPITHPLEMGESFPHVLSKLKRHSLYPQLFYEAFGDSLIKGEYFLKALAQFQLTFVSANAKYDQVMRNEENVHFTDQELKGYELFKTHCSPCHPEPLFTTRGFANNGLPVDSQYMDLGRYTITQDSADLLKFKIPTLRNIEFSKPYMHDGRFRKLSQAIKHYTDGMIQTAGVDSVLQKGVSLNSNERVDLEAFLLTLSDKEFLFNADYTFPRK